MLTFKQFTTLTEAKVDDGAEPKLAVFAFGRFNPPTKGHMKLVDRVHEIAAEQNGHAFIFPSQTVDKIMKKTGKVNPERSRNPLQWEEKIQFMREVLPHPETIIRAPEVKTPHQAMEWLHNKGFTHVMFVVGADRVSEFNTNWLPYAQEMFQEAEVVSAGQRDPDSEGIVGMSGTKAREAAKAGNEAKFTVATGWSGEVGRRMMKAVRAGMGL